MERRHPAPTRPTPFATLEYATPCRPAGRWDDYVLDLLISAVAVGLVSFVLGILAPQFRHIYRTYQLEVPGLTQLLLGASDIYHSYGLWMLVWVVPVVTPFLTARLPNHDPSPRPAARAAFLLGAVLFAVPLLFVFLVLTMPLVTLSAPMTAAGGR